MSKLDKAYEHTSDQHGCSAYYAHDMKLKP